MDMNEHSAASKIQARFRGNQVRKRPPAGVKAPSRPPPKNIPLPPPNGNDEQEQKQAAILIQKTYRGKVARQQTNKIKPPPGVKAPNTLPPGVVPPSNNTLPRGVVPPLNLNKTSSGSINRPSANIVGNAPIRPPGVRLPSNDPPPITVKKQKLNANVNIPRPPSAPSGDTDEQRLAATKIQASFRGRRTRKHLKKKPSLPPKPPPGIRPPSTEEQNAATKIQASFRGKRARKQMKEKKEAPKIKVSGLQLQEKLKREREKVRALENDLKQCRYLIGSKERAMEELRDKVAERIHDLGKKKEEIDGLKLDLKYKQEEIDEMKQEQEEGDQDFDLMQGEVDKKDGLLAKKRLMIMDLQDKVRLYQKQSERFQVIVRRQEKQIEQLMPETVDIALSARSYTENMTVHHRDEIIKSKEEHLETQNKQIIKLMENLEQVEAEVEKMQNDIINKDIECNRRANEVREYEKKNKELERQISQHKGQKAAVEISTKQNSKLLQLLQQQEAKNEELKQEYESLSKTIDEQKGRALQALKEKASLEVRCEAAEREAKHSTQQLSTVVQERDGIRMQLTTQMSELRRKARAKVDAVHEELRTRREKQYSLLDRLHAAEEAFRKAQDEVETLRETSNALQERTLELDARLIEAKLWREEDSEKQEEEANKANLVKQQHADTLTILKEEKIALKRQLQEMASTVLQLVEKNREKENECQVEKEKALDYESEIEALRVRVRSLLHEGKRQGQLRVVAESNQGTLKTQLMKMSQEYSTSLDIREQDHLKFVQTEKEYKTRCNVLEDRLRSDRRARLAVINRYIHNHCIADTKRSNIHCDLSFCGISLDKGDEIEKVLPLFAGKYSISEIDLSNNSITDTGLLFLAEQLALLSSHPITKLSLNHNRISPEGVRLLAEALQSADYIRHVYVRKNGIVEGLGLTQSNNESSPSTKDEETLSVVTTIDIRDNFGTHVSGSKKTEFEITHERKLMEEEKSQMKKIETMELQNKKRRKKKKKKHLMHQLKSDADDSQKTLKATYGEIQTLKISKNEKKKKKNLPKVNAKNVVPHV